MKSKSLPFLWTCDKDDIFLILTDTEKKFKESWGRTRRGYITRARNRASSGGRMRVVHGRRGGCRWTSIGSFICCFLEEIVLQGIEWRDAAFRVVVQHAQDQVWRRTNIDIMMVASDNCSVNPVMFLVSLALTWYLLLMLAPHRLEVQHFNPRPHPFSQLPQLKAKDKGRNINQTLNWQLCFHT